MSGQLFLLSNIVAQDLMVSPYFVANQCIDNFIEPLTYIINMSFMEGVFPSDLKLAKVVPIFKSVDSTKMSNYRPISILSFFQKYLRNYCIIL